MKIEVHNPIRMVWSYQLETEPTKNNILELVSEEFFLGPIGESEFLAAVVFMLENNVKKIEYLDGFKITIKGS